LASDRNGLDMIVGFLAVGMQDGIVKKLEKIKKKAWNASTSCQKIFKIY